MRFRQIERDSVMTVCDSVRLNSRQLFQNFRWEWSAVCVLFQILKRDPTKRRLHQRMDLLDNTTALTTFEAAGNIEPAICLGENIKSAN